MLTAVAKALGVNPNTLLWLLIGWSLIYFFSSIEDVEENRADDGKNWLLYGLLATLTITTVVVDMAKIGMIFILIGITIISYLRDRFSLKLAYLSAMLAASIIGILIPQTELLWFLIVTIILVLTAKYYFYNTKAWVYLAVCIVIIWLALVAYFAKPYFMIGAIAWSLIDLIGMVLAVSHYAHHNIIADFRQWYYEFKEQGYIPLEFILSFIGSGLYLGPIIMFYEGIIQGSWILGLMLGIWPLAIVAINTGLNWLAGQDTYYAH